MSFGKRQSGMVVSAPAVNAGMSFAPSATISSAASADAATSGAAAPGQTYSEPAEQTRHPFRSLIGLLICVFGLYGLIANYSRDIVRDHLLHGTWQPAYDLRATDGKCSRTNFVVTTCTTHVKSVAMPDQAPISVDFLMLFSSGGGEALIPVRSTKDRSAVSIYYAAETKLWNRTLSFLFFVCALALFGVVALFSFLKALELR